MDKKLDIRNSDKKIQVNKILCLGLNYNLHIDEMKSEKPAEPVIFMKPSTSILKDGGEIIIPSCSTNVHHEIELVVVIGKEGKHIKKENAEEYILGFALGLDITLRDIQSKSKKKGHPWTVAKGFDTSAPISEIIPKEDIADYNNLNLKLWVNDELRQDGNTDKMIFKIDEIIAYLSSIFTLEEGDLIFTGTPEGVSQIHAGDNIKASLQEIVEIEFNVVHDTL